MIDAYVTKGTRVKASWMDTKMVGLAGVQTKMEAVNVTVTGVVRHIRSDHPTMPVNATFFLDVESGSNHDGHETHCTKCGCDHVEVKAKHVVAVLDPVNPPGPLVPSGGGGDGV